MSTATTAARTDVRPIDYPEIRRAISAAAKKGLTALEKPVPLRLSEWADQHFYLSSESSSVEGRWQCLSFQRGIMDVISNDDVREVWVPKSARVGYTKIILAGAQYFCQHKKRNVAIWQPTDEDRDEFAKTEVETSIRDNPLIRSVFPAYDKKSKHNTLSLKQFIGASLHLRGGKAAKNYRRLTVDTAILDELDGFDHDVQREGPPTELAKRRVQTANFPKFIAGSTPKLAVHSPIEIGERHCEIRLRWHVRCPHCEHEQVIRWGGKNDDYGLKWEKDEKGRLDETTVVYQCESCHGQFDHNQYRQQTELGRWRSVDETGASSNIWLDENGLFRDLDNGDKLADTPRSVGFHVWSGINELVPWSEIVREWLAAVGDKKKLQSFINLTLGESWETDETEQMDSEVLHRTRREHYECEVPDGVTLITAGIDTQDDRFEVQYDGWGPDEERWSIAYDVIHGDLNRPVVWEHLTRALARQFRKKDGQLMETLVACIDRGGHYGDDVDALSVRLNPLFLIPCRGLSHYGKPIVNFPRTKNDNGVYLVTVGTDTAKDLLWNRLKVTDPGPGYWHFPVSEDFDETYFNQLTAQRRIRKITRGQERYVWDGGGRRDEAWDCSVLSLVAMRIARQKFGVDLDQGPTEPAPQAARSRPAKKRATNRRRSSFWDR